MTPEEFEENARIITGDPTWSLTDDGEKVTHLQTAPSMKPPLNHEVSNPNQSQR